MAYYISKPRKLNSPVSIPARPRDLYSDIYWDLGGGKDRVYTANQYSDEYVKYLIDLTPSGLASIDVSKYHFLVSDLLCDKISDRPAVQQILDSIKRKRDILLYNAVIVCGDRLARNSDLKRRQILKDNFTILIR